MDAMRMFSQASHLCPAVSIPRLSAVSCQRCCLCLLDSDLNWGQPLSSPAWASSRIYSEIRGEGCHQDCTKQGRENRSLKYEGICSSETNNVWVDSRKSQRTENCWAVLGEIADWVPGTVSGQDNVRIMSRKTAPAADFPLINHPMSGWRCSLTLIPMTTVIAFHVVIDQNCFPLSVGGCARVWAPWAEQHNLFARSRISVLNS